MGLLPADHQRVRLRPLGALFVAAEQGEGAVARGGEQVAAVRGVLQCGRRQRVRLELGCAAPVTGIPHPDGGIGGVLGSAGGGAVRASWVGGGADEVVAVAKHLPHFRPQGTLRQLLLVGRAIQRARLRVGRHLGAVFVPAGIRVTRGRPLVPAEDRLVGEAQRGHRGAQRHALSLHRAVLHLAVASESVNAGGKSRGGLEDAQHLLLRPTDVLEAGERAPLALRQRRQAAEVVAVHLRARHLEPRAVPHGSDPRRLVR
mmetsp:Transcript_25031/g.63119  ORF Transcript_25031/g.63119 Transcript_25031/m.63119 type:complete len:259 (-) Transcript_25031:126-902(-)